MLKAGDILPFIRKRDYEFVKYIGRGGLGATVLLNDALLDIKLVCKKYQPADSGNREAYFENFVREMKVMHNVHHPNIIRIYTCFPYPSLKTGYILMEFVDGNAIDEYLAANPSSIDEVFRQVVDGFIYLESVGILHRDIRNSNILVTHDGTVKIIDFGFGKQIDFPSDVDKSISIAWPYTTPLEFTEKRYDFCTECYFVGKMFEQLISDLQLTTFSHNEVLSKMCEYSYKNRYKSFADIGIALAEGSFAQLEFDHEDFTAYQAMAGFLSSAITKMRSDIVYVKDPDVILLSLGRLLSDSALEEEVQNTFSLVGCFIEGNLYCKKNVRFAVSDLIAFSKFFKAQSRERQMIVLSNLWARFELIPSYYEEDIPF